MKTFLMWSIVAAGIVGAVAVYLLFGTPKEEVVTSVPTQQPAPQKEASTVVPTSGSGSLSSLLALNQDLECSIMYAASSVDQTQTQGTYFTSAGKMRGDFVVSSNGVDTVSSLIMRDGMLYSWTEIEGASYGMKIAMSELEASKNTQGAPVAQEVVPLEAEVDYTCKAWTALDNSIFEPPTDILFREFGEVVDMGMEFGTMYEGGEAMASQCAACEDLAGSERTQCRQMLSCE